MLRQEDPQPQQNTPPSVAAQTRVTPEELAHAIAAIEARKLDDAKQIAGTIPIGEAVRELDLDATPEELLAEVRAQREARTPPPATAQAKTPPAPPPPIAVPPLPQTIAQALRQAAIAAAPGLKDAAIAASPALKKGMDAVSQRVKERKRDKRGWRRQSWLAFGIFFAFAGLSQTGLLHGHHGAVNIGVHVADPQPVLLSSVPDGHEVYADTTTVVNIAHGANPATVSVQDGSRSDNTWRLIRHDKHWYVRGFVLRDTDFSNGITKVYNDNNAGILEGQHEEDVTVRLDNSTIADTNASDDWSEIDMSKVQPDTHTHEDW